MTRMLRLPRHAWVGPALSGPHQAWSVTVRIMEAIDREGAVPPYRQLYQILRKRIESGDIPAGRRLPSELTLEAEYGISRNTIRKAIDLLRADDLVETVPGLGIAVRERPETSGED